MKLDVEKPLIEVGGKPLIEHVINTLKECGKVDSIYVAVSKRTTQTAERMKAIGVEFVDTPGEGYVRDMKHAVKKLQLGKVLLISSDLPFITNRLINKIIEKYEDSGKPALAVMCPLEVYRKLGLDPVYTYDVNGRDVSPVGVNLIDANRIDELEMEEEILILDDERLALNINTLTALKAAEKFYRNNRKR